jgi:DNA-binding transcriptional regulator YiaG
MRLQPYLDLKNLSHADFGKLVGASEFGVRKWARGERTPRPEAIRKIQEVTAGAVSAADFFGEVAA